MNLEKKYYDENGNKINILQLIKKSPKWAANRIQEGEKAFKHITTLSHCLAEACKDIIDLTKNYEMMIEPDWHKQDWEKVLADANDGKTWQQILEKTKK
jgi:hypothetical protein